MTPVQHIRQAAAHEDAAERHSGKLEEQMKAAGAEMYTAFGLAARSCEELKGRKIDDKALLRLYKSTQPRPWWDAAIKEAGFAKSFGDKIARQKASYLIQWHVDIDAARTRRSQGLLQQSAAQQRLRKQRTASARSMTSRSERAVTAREAERITATASNAAARTEEFTTHQQQFCPTCGHAL